MLFNFNLGYQAALAKRLAYLLSSGLGLIESLETTASDREIWLHSIKYDIQNGLSFSSALTLYQRYLDPLFISIVKVGETTGTLSKSLQYLGEYIERKKKFREEILSALIYPTIILVISVALILFLLLFIFPKIIPVFQDLKVDLPLTTKFLLLVFNVFHHWWFVFVILFAGLAFFLWRIIKNPANISTLISKLLRIPRLRNFVQNILSVSICRSLGILLSSGGGLLSSLYFVRESHRGVFMKGVIQELINHIESGKNLPTFLALREDVFPLFLRRFVLVGEKVGGLSKMFFYSAEYLEQEISLVTKRLASLIEPVLMIVVGFVIGFIALSIISPIYELTGNLHG